MAEPKVRLVDSLRLGLLYCLRYEGSTKGDLTKVERLLISRGHTDEDKRVGVASEQLHWTLLYPPLSLSLSLSLSLGQIMRALLEHSGRAKRGPELFESQGTLAKTKKFFTKGLKVSLRYYSILHESLFQCVCLCSILSCLYSMFEFPSQFSLFSIPCCVSVPYLSLYSIPCLSLNSIPGGGECVHAAQATAGRHTGPAGEGETK